MRLLFSLLLIVVSTLVSGQEVSVYLIGDAGAPTSPDRNLDFLQKITKEAKATDVLIFLGDNLYPDGLPSKEDPARGTMENKLNASLNIMKAFKGRSIILPGNHDWSRGGKDGWKKVLNMQRYVDEYMGTSTVFLPRDACPGPVEIPLTNALTLLIVDTQYFLHPWDKPGREDGCESKSTAEALEELDDLLKRNADKHVIVAGHHPMHSYGPHGGQYTLKQHIFPLTDVNRKLWIPLPILGSIYPIFRSVFGSRQDITNPRYKLVRNTMVKSFAQVKDLVYVNGHEHSLQYIRKDSAHYITSGSGSKSSNVSDGANSLFSSAKRGFAQLTYHAGGSVDLKFFNGDLQEKIYDSPIYTKKVNHKSNEMLKANYSDSTVVRPISLRYAIKSNTHEFWLGENYRQLWSTPVSMPVFNIDLEHGGLEILKLGGGNQTKSLRLEAKNGRQYVLRSLDKYTTKLLPAPLYETLAADIVQDQISAANPYGVFAIPPLAEAAGIYHTNPQLMYVLDDPRFGPYQSLFAHMPVLYEERPNDDAASEDYFGGGEKIEGTPDVIATIQGDNDEVIDQDFALRNRLFDMLIGDWDRHEDQWRWVRLDQSDKGHYWRPIPRDRDQAFFVNEGMIGWAASRKFALPNTEGFDEKMDYPPGFNASARFFDRTFLNALDWSQWEKQIDILNTRLTNELIDSAFNVWPDTIRLQAAQETSRILKARRDDMRRYARIYYLFLSREVEVVGTNKHEYFLVERISNEATRVTVHKRKKDGEVLQIIYQRTFLSSETEEIRLYGLEGEDVFEIKGQVKSGIRIRIIGGEDNDKITDHSRVNGLKHHTVVYDLKQNTQLHPSKETKSRLSNNINVNAYNRTAFEYDKLIPLASVEFNFDDGLFLGGGFILTKEGWRKDPFAARHQLKINGAFETGAVNLYYNGTLSDVIEWWDLNLDFTLQRPFGVSNFFGFGNESSYDFKGQGDASGFEDEIDFYRIRFERSQTYLNLAHSIGAKGSFRMGPEHLSYELENKIQDRYIHQPNSGTDPEALYKSHQYVGYRAEIATNTRNHPELPTSGVFAQLIYGSYYGLNARSRNFSTLKGEFIFYLSTRIPSKVTFANRIGAQFNEGSLEFFNGAILDKETLRGYRRGRFIGEASLYHNFDLRAKLFSFKTYLFPASVGILGFHDIGRVWLKSEQSDTWHTSKGFGLWVAPLNQLVVTANMAFSKEETLPTVTFGYQF